ncbi:MAG: hypothetical protein ABJE95_33395 [Byssovorax sp.]
MALPKLGLNEGSLLRRTLLHVATFVLGSVAFVSLVSLLLVSAARSLSPHAGGSDATTADGDDADPSAKPGLPGMKPGIPGMKPGLKKKALPTTAERPKDE